MLNKRSYDFELNWYDFETRTRRLVFELLQPTVTRSTEDREIIYSMRRKIEGHRQKIEELEYCLFKSD